MYLNKTDYVIHCTNKNEVCKQSRMRIYKCVITKKYIHSIAYCSIYMYIEPFFLSVNFIEKLKLQLTLSNFLHFEALRNQKFSSQNSVTI